MVVEGPERAQGHLSMIITFSAKVKASAGSSTRALPP
jgi:hypothetical protein